MIISVKKLAWFGCFVSTAALANQSFSHVGFVGILYLLLLGVSVYYAVD